MVVASSRCAWGLVFAFAGIALCATSARAQRTSSLSWVRLAGAEDCIPTQTLAERVEQRVGRQVFVSASQADLSLEGHVERAPAGDAFVATLEVSDRSGHVLGKRVLRAPGSDCSALDPALVLVIAIGLDPDAALPATRDASDRLSDDTQALLAQLELPKLDERALRELAVPDPAAARAEEQRAREIAARAARPRTTTAPPIAISRNAPRAVRLDVSLGVAGELGVLPDPALGASMRLAFGFGAFWPIELSGSAVLDQEEPGELTGGRGELSFWAAGLALCLPSNSAKSFELVACAGARAGLLRVNGAGFARDRASSSPWFEPSARVGPSLRLGAARRWLLQLLVGAGVPVIRDTYRYSDERGQLRTLHRAGWLIGRIELASGVSF